MKRIALAIAACLAVVLACLVPQASQAQSFFLIEHAQYHTCINSYGASPGRPVRLYQCESVNSELWAIQDSPLGHGLVEIKNHNGLCLADSGDSATPGKPTEMWTCSPTTLQGDRAVSWGRSTITIGGIEYARFVNANAVVCLNDYNNRNSNGNPIVVAHCVTSLSEAWI